MSELCQIHNRESHCSACVLEAQLECVKAELNQAVYMQDKVRSERDRAETERDKLRADLAVAVECIALAQTSECADYCEPSAQDPSKRVHSVYCEMFSEALGKMGKG
jgi:uncharacterized protein (DUF3084 family)